MAIIESHPENPLGDDRAGTIDQPAAEPQDATESEG